MKRVLTLGLVLCALTVGSRAQEVENFTFYNDLDRVDTNVDPLMVPNHYLGPEIGLKTYLLKGLYTEVEEGNEINPVDKTIVFKPAIYYSMKKLNNYYKKAVKKGIITEQEAIDKMNTYLDICLAIYLQETQQFETELKKYKKTEDIDAVFSRVVLE
jgi:hypothetical protein